MAPDHHEFRRQFWTYFAGQTLSNLGSAFTTVAFPLLVYRLTGSAADLGAAMAVTYAPWALFGLVGGAVVDRVDRRRAMVAADVARGVTIAVVPALAALGDLRLGAVYAVMFVQSCLQVPFSGAAFAAVAALVEPDDLVTANGRLQAGFSVAEVAGTALAGLFFAVAPVADALWIDAASFLASAASLAAIRRSFNAEPPAGLRRGSLRALAAVLASDTRAGLSYVWRHPVLRGLSLQLALVNLFGSAANAEIALFAARRLGADNAQVGYLYATSSAGVVVLSWVVGPLGRRVSLATVVLIALCLYGTAMAVLGTVTSYPLALVVWGCVGGATVLYNVSTASLRQRIVPNELMGRVWNVALTFAWCAIPAGSLAGGAVIDATGRVGLVYVVAGVTITGIALLFNRVLRGNGTAADRAGASKR